MSAGASLFATNSTVDGPLKAEGAGSVLLDRTTVSGPIDISKSSGQVVVLASSSGGPLKVTDNNGGTALAGNSIGGPMECKANSPTATDFGWAAYGQPNLHGGPSKGQCPD